MRISNLLGKPIESKNYQTSNQVIALNIVNFASELTPPRPPDALPSLNAMPPLSTNIIEDDDTSYPISEPDSDRFTHSGGGDDAPSDSTPNTLPQSRLVKDAS